MRIYSLTPDSTTQKTAICYPLSRGYRFHLSDEDGVELELAVVAGKAPVDLIAALAKA